ncbi:hypothetical protein MASR1M49_27680 [Pararhodobacter aggregans]
MVANFGWGSGTGAGKRVQDMTELEFSVRQQKEAGMAHPQDRAPLDRWRADEILEPEQPLWGLPLIARVMGVSVDTARRYARDPAVPISQPEGTGQYFAYRSELQAWLKAKR